jgi:hypothetical protein
LWRSLALALHITYGQERVAARTDPARVLVTLGAVLVLGLLTATDATATVTKNFNSGTGALTVSSDAGDQIKVDCIGGNVEINDSTVGNPTCASVTAMTLNGGGLANVINVVGIRVVADLPGLAGPIVINGNGGVDDIQGSGIADTITGGAGANIVDANGGADTIKESGFDGNASADGGTGSDTLVVTGAGFYTVNTTTAPSGTVTNEGADWAFSNIELIDATTKGSADGSVGATNSPVPVTARGNDVKNDLFTTGPFNDSFDGKTAFINDNISAQTDSASITLTDSTLTGTDIGTDSLTSIESASLTSLGGTVANNWNAAGFTGGIDGNAGQHIVSMASGPGADTLTGGPGDDPLNGEEGDDTLTGRAGTDNLTGGPGTDTAKETGVTGAAVFDTFMSTPPFGNAVFAEPIERVDLTGSAAGDTMTATDFAGRAKFDGAGGEDDLTGTEHDDELIGGPDPDTFAAAGGADTVRADDGTVDTSISCGEGSDVAFADDGEPVDPDCETITRPGDVVPGGGGPGGGVTTAIAPGVMPDSVRPAVAGLSLGSRTFAAAARGGSIAAAVGTQVSYRLSEPATARFTVERRAAGRRVGRRCVAPKRRNRAKRRCTRFVKVKGAFTHPGKSGANSFKFSGRLRGRKLKAGRYRLVIVATDAAGNKSVASRAPFRIVRR